MDLTKFKHIYELVQYLINHIDYFGGNFVLEEAESGDKIVYDYNIVTFSPYGTLKGTVYVNEDNIYIEILGDESPDDSILNIIAKGGYTVNIPYLIFTLDDKDDPYGLLPEVIKGSEEDIKIYNNFFTT